MSRTAALGCALLAAAPSAAPVLVFAPPGHAPGPTAQKTQAPTTRSGDIRVALQPSVVVRGQRAMITVSGNLGSAPQVKIAGATVNLGHSLPWVPLHRTAQGWQALLPAPEFRGVYRIRLRTAPTAPAFGADGWLLHVFARGTLTR